MFQNKYERQKIFDCKKYTYFVKIRKLISIFSFDYVGLPYEL